MRRILLLLALLATPAGAQVPSYPANPTLQSSLALVAPTPPLLDNSFRIPNTSWVNSVITGGLVAATHYQNIVAPGTPPAGQIIVYGDSTFKNLQMKNDLGTVTTMVAPKVAVANQYLTQLATTGVLSSAQPAFTDLSGSIAGGQIPANTVTRAMQAQGQARSVIGVTGNATANVADIQGTASQFLGVNSAGTALAFQTMSGDATLSGPAITVTKINGVDQTAAWTTFTPTVAAQTPGGTPPTFGTVSGRYQQIGKTIFCEMDIPITAAGTGTGYISATLPLAARNSPFAGASQDYNLSQKSGGAIINPIADLTHVYIRDSTSATMIATGAKIAVSITYELP